MDNLTDDNLIKEICPPKPKENGEILEKKRWKRVK